MTLISDPSAARAAETPSPSIDDATPVAPAALPPASWRSPIEGSVACALALVWFAAYAITGLVEPAPRDPAIMHAWYVELINGVFLGALGVMIVGLALRRRVGVLASIAATGAFLTAVVACPITGHHEFGLWWFGELACVAAVAAATGIALHRTHGA